ncbi:MAG: YihY/virulence factor BrkB family protein [Terriglobia bacterium]
MRLLPATFSLGGLHKSCWTFIHGMWSKMNADDAFALSAQMSFYFVLALFPFLILLAALIGTLPFTGLWDSVLAWIILYLPRTSQHLVFQTIVGLTNQHVRFLSIGLVGTAWASTGGTLSLMSALNIVYQAKETRSYVHRVGFSLLVLCVLAFLFIGTFGLLTAGNWVGGWVARHGPSPHAIVWLWHIGRWALSFVFTALAVAIIDNTFPNRQLRWHWISSGMLFTVVVWVLSTNAFNFYISHFGGYERTYGVLGIFVILMIWIYISSLIIIVGAEINCQRAGRCRS